MSTGSYLAIVPPAINIQTKISQLLNFKLRYNREQAKTLTTKSMFTYSKVLNQVKSLTLAEQLRLLEDLKKMIQLREEVAEDDEVISAEEIAESEAAWQDYQAKRDRGISSQELKLKLFGEKID
ncbi:hypothetical protein [Tychonema sp. BBK16]|uniref:hypothetical protein n=2 Tax=Tychonema sp. BBK16 TaxID=2699888 RepID=UPI001F185F9D|nr:hypothetical protein [Tychonema sp. BBK16]MCF6375650.1 hypothetical protein [Tychonema sp. BBK16]